MNKDRMCGDLEGAVIDLCEVKKEIKSKRYTIYIDAEISEPLVYRKALNVLEKAKKDDEVVVKVASNGGILDSGLMLVEAISNCKATTVADLVFGASAATLITLACKNIKIYDSSYMMLHTFSSGAIGKGQELKVLQKFHEQHTEGLIRKCYKGFLTDDEISKMLEGQDYWIHGEDLLERLLRANKAVVKV